jgi:hypothetical protein
MLRWEMMRACRNSMDRGWCMANVDINISTHLWDF